MKRLLPHLLYLSLITGLSIFLWRCIELENQQIALLNQPTDEAYIAIERQNRLLKNSIKRHVESYPMERSKKIRQQVRVADSLLARSYQDEQVRDSLASWFWEMTNRDQQLEPIFKDVLPPQNQVVKNPIFQGVLSQNDSLRRQLAFLNLLNYFEMQVGGYLDLRFDSYQPVASFSTLCPRVGEPFEMDVLLSDYPPRADITKLNVNGQSLSYEDGLAHFEQTFYQPGIYPLQVKVEYQPFWETNSALHVEKTFHLHVNR